jgi:hypothetical protein
MSVSFKTRVVLLIAGLLLIAFFGWQFYEKKSTGDVLPADVERSYPSKLVMPSPPVDRLAIAADTHQVNPNEPPLLWVMVNETIPVELAESVTEKAVIRFDWPLLASLQKDDEIQFTLPDGRAVFALVNRVVINPDGDKTFQAQIKTEFGEYPFTYTMGIKSGFGFIGLPEGRFSIETKGVYSVVYRNPEQPRPVDPGKKDYVIPKSQ